MTVQELINVLSKGLRDKEIRDNQEIGVLSITPKGFPVGGFPISDISVDEGTGVIILSPINTDNIHLFPTKWFFK